MSRHQVIFMHPEFKFRVGQMVRVNMSHKDPNWVWVGRVYKRSNVDYQYFDEDGNFHSFNEYWVDNAPSLFGGLHPLLAWEEEINADGLLLTHQPLLLTHQP